MTDAAEHDDETDAPAARPVALPPSVDANGAVPHGTWLWEGAEGNLWFEGAGVNGRGAGARARVLIVAFDNLATLDDPYPRLPWLHARSAALGLPLLGVQSFRKDWYRQETAPERLRALTEAGFFAAFDRVLLVGASMGGFAALNFAPLIPGARVLAFSPQSTMSRVIAPFERRFAFSVDRSDWTRPAFLDAQASIPYQTHATILYDPFVPEDRQHAARLRGDRVTFLKVGHFTHQAIRFVLKCDALDLLLTELALGDRVGPEFHRRLRARRDLRSWRRSFVETLAKSAHPKLALRVCERFLQDEPYLFATRAKRDILARHPELRPPRLRAGTRG